MLRLNLLFGRGTASNYVKCGIAINPERPFSNPIQDEGCTKKKKVKCYEEVMQPKSSKKSKSHGQSYRPPPLPSDCRRSYDPRPKKSPTPYRNPCKTKVGCCTSDMHPRPCLSQCTRKRSNICYGEPDCANERRANWEKLIKQLALGAILVIGGVIIYRYQPRDKLSARLKKSTKKSKKFPRPMEPVKIPEFASEIPHEIEYLIIGGGAAAHSAQAAIRSVIPEAKILIVNENPPYMPSMRPPLSDWLWKEPNREMALNLQFHGWDGKLHDLELEHRDYYTPVNELESSPVGGVGVAQGWSVKKLQHEKHIAFLDDGTKINYDKCLLATGASPKTPEPLNDPEIADKVTFYRNSYDFQELEEIIEEGGKVIAVVGGGLLGTELTVALKERCKQSQTKIISIVKDDGYLKKILPSYLSKKVYQLVKGEDDEEDFQILLESTVEDVEKVGSRVKLFLSNSRCVSVDHVIVAVGVDPNVQLAETSCIETDPVNGGFMVNSEMQVSSSLYAAGDCASYYDCTLGRRREEHHNHAVVTGKIAGENMAGITKPITEQPTFWSHLYLDYELEGVGLVGSNRATVGVFSKTAQKSDEEEEVLPGHSYTMEEYDKIEDDTDFETKMSSQEFNKGVVYYLDDEQVIVGIVTINLPGRIETAQNVIVKKKTYDDINNLTKHFRLHE